MKRPGLGLVLALALGPVYARAGSIQDTRQDLDQIRRRLAANELALKNESLSERRELGELDRLNRQWQAARRDLDTHRHNLGLVRQRLSLLEAEVARLKSQEASGRRALATDLVELYRWRVSLDARLKLGPAAPSADVERRVHYLGALAAATEGGDQAVRADLSELDAYRRDFDRRYAALMRRLRAADRRSARYERERSKGVARLRRVRSGKARASRAVRELRASADRLSSVLDNLVGEARRQEDQDRRRRAAAEEAARTGSTAEDGGAGAGGSGGVEELEPYAGPGLGRDLAWPVHGPLLERFGKHLHPRFHVPVFNRGIEIGAPFGTPVRAVAAGRVDYAGTLEGFGRLVVVDHGRGMLSVYGYGSRLEVRKGQRVRRGEVLEDVGTADGARRSSLYFEIRRGVKARNPLDYLARR